MNKKLKRTIFLIIIIILFILLLIGIVTPIRGEKEKNNKNIKPNNSYKYKSNYSNRSEISKESVSSEVKTNYQVKFDGNNGEGNMDSITCISYEICKLPKNLFSKKGHQFIGWSLEKGGNIILNDQSYFKNLSPKSGGIVTLYAKWDKNRFNILFLDYNSKLLFESRQAYGDIIEFPSNPDRVGYTFLGWDNDTTKVEKEEVYNAKYKANNYSISYNLNGGVLLEKPTLYNIETNDINIKKPIKYGYIFTGWKINNSNFYIESYTIKKGSYGNLNLEAIYEPKEYKINFNTNGGNENFDFKTVKFNDKYGKLPIPTKKGYSFVGWSNNNELVDSNNIVNSDNDISLIATWLPNEYDIKLNPNGGSLEQREINIKYDTKYGKLPIPTRNGYKFKGWYYNDEMVKSDTIMEKDYNHELKANWEANKYNVTYLDSAGNLYERKIILSTEKIPYLDYKVDKYHIFEGWKNTNGADISSISSPITEDITLKASVREANCYLLTGQAQDGDNSRIVRFGQLLNEKGLNGRMNLESTGYYSYVSDASNYSHVINAANHLLINAPSNTWPALRWLLLSCENGYAEQLR